jgi:hypothetical protein
MDMEILDRRRELTGVVSCSIRVNQTADMMRVAYHRFSISTRRKLISILLAVGFSLPWPHWQT